MGFGADFLGGLAGGIGNGLNLYGQLQGIAMRQKQMDMAQQMEQRRQAQLDAETAQNQASTLVNAAKIPNPAVRKQVFSMLGLDPSMADALGGEDAALNQDFQTWANQMGSTPEGARVFASIMQNDPARAAEGILAQRRMQIGADTANERMQMQSDRLDMARQQFGLSQERFNQLQMMQQLRAQGMIPPMNYAPAPGGGFAPVPGSAAALPSNEERSVASFLKRAQDSEQMGLAFSAQNPEYLNSFQASVDRMAQNPDLGKEVGGGLGAAAGAVAGGITGARVGHPLMGASIGTAAGGKLGTELGSAASSFIQQHLTSDLGKQFVSVWSPFISGVVYGDTGKVVQASEWSRALDQWIPVPGDSQERIAEKAANRASAMQGMIIKAGRAGPNQSGFTPPGTWDRTPQMRTLAPSAEQEAAALAQRYRSGQATPAEIQKLQGYLRAKGLSWQ